LNLKELPYSLLLLTALLLFAVGFFVTNTIDIHLHDTYFVLPFRLLIWSMAIIFVLLWVLYLVTKKALLSKTLSWIHILLTILSCLFLITMFYWMNDHYEGLAAMPRRYLASGITEQYDYLNNQAKATWLSMLILMFSQITYVVNLSVGLYQRAVRRNKH
jgi:heme/copper-type cytochrome/quinol oxidase subunit 1